MSPFVIVSRNHVLNNEKSQKIVDFVNDSGYFFAILSYFATKARENADLKKEKFFQICITKISDRTPPQSFQNTLKTS